jgi:hypothetical protein
MRADAQQGNMAVVASKFVLAYNTRDAVQLVRDMQAEPGNYSYEAVSAVGERKPDAGFLTRVQARLVPRKEVRVESRASHGTDEQVG